MNNISKYYLTFVVIIDLRNLSGGGGDLYKNEDFENDNFDYYLPGEHPRAGHMQRAYVRR